MNEFCAPLYSAEKKNGLRVHSFYYPRRNTLTVSFASNFRTIVNGEEIDVDNVYLLVEFFNLYRDLITSSYVSRKLVIKATVMLSYIYLKADLYERVSWKVYLFKKGLARLRRVKNQKS